MRECTGKGGCESVKEKVSYATEILIELKKNSKRWFIAFIITLVLLACTNMAWLYVFQSYDYVTEDYQQDGNGNNNINTGNGNISNSKG